MYMKLLVRENKMNKQRYREIIADKEIKKQDISIQVRDALTNMVKSYLHINNHKFYSMSGIETDGYVYKAYANVEYQGYNKSVYFVFAKKDLKFLMFSFH